MTDEMIPIRKLPFPQERLVRMVKSNFKRKRTITTQAKQELNLWLKAILDRVSARINASQYHAIDVQAVRDAVEPYEKIERLNLERERLAKCIMAIKAQCDVLLEELERNYKI